MAPHILAKDFGKMGANIAFNHAIARWAQQDKVLGIITFDKDQAPFGVNRNDFDD